MKCMLTINSSVVPHGGADPAVVAAYTSVHTRVSLHGAVVSPGHDSLQLTTAHQGATGVSLQTHMTKEEVQFKV